MQIKSIIIENFRGYKTRQVIELTNLTAFVGKNDVGKSTILEALDIFFNNGKGVVSIDKKDVNVDSLREANGGNVDVVIGVEFFDIPTTVLLDDNNTTSLANEKLLNEQGNLTILKHYPNGGGEKVYIYAFHPTHSDCCDLLVKKQNELRKLANDLTCDHNKNAEMRAAIWALHEQELNCEMQEIDASKEDAKNIWIKLKEYLPVYCLFQSDRSNGDNDKEVQDPLKEAVKIIFRKNEIKSKCKEIYDEVLHELEEVSSRTVDKVREMNEALANTLDPTMPPSENLKWSDLFKSVSITGDNGIPINKRGSGVKRLILLNFFRAEAERTQQNQSAPGIIYAIEEPETAQHIEHQTLLMKSLINLSQKENTQVIITTHSSNILKCISFNDIRLIEGTATGKKVTKVSQSQLPYPSLNEIAFSNFGEASIEYHDELYGHIEFMQWMGEYKNGRNTFTYNKAGQHGNIQSFNLTKTEIIRHQIHHPENHNNPHFTDDELKQSIIDMRQFIDSKNINP